MSQQEKKSTTSETQQRQELIEFTKQHIWDLRFLKMARLVSTWSKDPSTKVGALAVGYRRRMLAQGYNGFPSGMDDSPERYAERDVKYGLVIHAEANVVYNATRMGISLEGAVVYVFGIYPCPECVKGLAQVGVVRVVFMCGESNNHQHWEDKWKLSKSIMKELGIAFMQYVHKPERDKLPEGDAHEGEVS